MKKLWNKKFFGLIIIVSWMASCTDDNNDVTPSNSDDRDKFVGSWICNEGTGTPFTITISKLSGDEINIENFSNYGSHGNAKCNVSGSGLSIPTQDINDLSSASVIASGTGVYSKQGSQEKITMQYNVDSVQFNNVVCTK